MLGRRALRSLPLKGRRTRSARGRLAGLWLGCLRCHGGIDPSDVHANDVHTFGASPRRRALVADHRAALEALQIRLWRTSSGESGVDDSRVVVGSECGRAKARASRRGRKEFFRGSVSLLSRTVVWCLKVERSRLYRIHEALSHQRGSNELRADWE